MFGNEVDASIFGMQINCWKIGSKVDEIFSSRLTLLLHFEQEEDGGGTGVDKMLPTPRDDKKFILRGK